MWRKLHLAIGAGADGEVRRRLPAVGPGPLAAQASATITTIATATATMVDCTLRPGDLTGGGTAKSLFSNRQETLIEAYADGIALEDLEVLGPVDARVWDRLRLAGLTHDVSDRSTAEGPRALPPRTWAVRAAPGRGAQTAAGPDGRSPLGTPEGRMVVAVWWWEVVGSVGLDPWREDFATEESGGARWTLERVAS